MKSLAVVMDRIWKHTRFNSRLNSN
jgi:hypothetical protein